MHLFWIFKSHTALKHVAYIDETEKKIFVFDGANYVNFNILKIVILGVQ
jgi:hypothetical protein